MRSIVFIYVYILPYLKNPDSSDGVLRNLYDNERTDMKSVYVQLKKPEWPYAPSARRPSRDWPATSVLLQMKNCAPPSHQLM